MDKQPKRVQRSDNWMAANKRPFGEIAPFNFFFISSLFVIPASFLHGLCQLNPSATFTTCPTTFCKSCDLARSKANDNFQPKHDSWMVDNYQCNEFFGPLGKSVAFDWIARESRWRWVSRMGVIKMRNSPWALSRCELMFALIITTVSAGRQASNYKDRKGVLTVAPCLLVSVVAPVLILGSNSPRSDRSTCTSGGNDCRRQPGCLLRPHCCIQRCHCHALCHWSHWIRGHCHLHHHPHHQRHLSPEQARKWPRVKGPKRRKPANTWTSFPTRTTMPTWAPFFAASLPHRKLRVVLLHKTRFAHWLICRLWSKYTHLRGHTTGPLALFTRRLRWVEEEEEPETGERGFWWVSKRWGDKKWRVLCWVQLKYPIGNFAKWHAKWECCRGCPCRWRMGLLNFPINPWHCKCPFIVM